MFVQNIIFCPIYNCPISDCTIVFGFIFQCCFLLAHCSRFAFYLRNISTCVHILCAWNRFHNQLFTAQRMIVSFFSLLFCSAHFQKRYQTHRKSETERDRERETHTLLLNNEKCSFLLVAHDYALFVHSSIFVRKSVVNFMFNSP